MEKLIILGCGSALPASNRNPTAQILEHSGRFFLIDCGEGTQSRLRENKLSFDKISDVFISHMHGDHYLGLPGLISSMQLLGRTKSLNLYGPSELWELLKFQFSVSKSTITFPLNFTPISEEKELLDGPTITVRSIELNHRISCFGFVFSEKEKPRRINGRIVKEVGVPHYKMQSVKQGEDYISEEGEVYLNSYLTLDPKKSNTYAFCSDNRIKGEFADKLRGVNYLYHESTFLHKELPRAKKTFHSTVKEACELGKDLNVDLLMLGHYSARYKELDELDQEAKEYFDKYVLVEGGQTILFNS